MVFKDLSYGEINAASWAYWIEPKTNQFGAVKPSQRGDGVCGQTLQLGLRSRSTNYLEFSTNNCGLLEQKSFTQKKCSQNMSIMPNSTLVNALQQSYNSAQSESTTCPSHVWEKPSTSELYEPMGRGERKYVVSWWSAKWDLRSLVFIWIHVGEKTCPLGFMSLHVIVSKRDNLHE